MSSLVIPVIDPAFKRPTGTWLAWKTTTNSAAVGGITRYPVGFTYAEVIRFLYGIRTFTISATAVGSYDLGPFSLGYGQTLTCGARNINNSSINSGFTNEAANLVTYQPSSGTSGTLYHEQVFDGTFTNMWTHRWHVFGSTGAEIPAPGGAATFTGLIFGSLYYPNLLNVVAINQMGLVSGYGIFPMGIGTTLGYGANGGTGLGPFNGTFLGKTIQYFATSIRPSFAVTSSSFTVTADSYWPYDPGDGGGPVYNTTTGAQIRDPFNL